MNQFTPVSATLGGLMLVGYSGQAYLGMGDAYLLPAIAVVVIGGTSIFGGKGSYIQTVAGALLDNPHGNSDEQTPLVVLAWRGPGPHPLVRA